MKTLIIGHRGVGKTGFIERLQLYHNDSVAVLDLDAVIETAEGLSISDIFDQYGEAEFRKLEKKYLEAALAKKGDAVIALGAGFQLDTIGRSALIQIWWLKRTTDSLGRIFLDRPRLNTSVSAFDEYSERFRARDALYAKVANETLVIDEGFEFANEPERKWARGEISNLGFDLTIQPAAFRISFQEWYLKRRHWGVRFFELRDDLLSNAQLNEAFTVIPIEHILFSFRSLAALTSSRRRLEDHANCVFDWASELGAFYEESRRPGFFSVHHRGERSLRACLAAAEAFQHASPSTILKIAVPIENFEELAEGHEWMSQDRERRVFLPCSSQGRWGWYRLWQRRNLKLNFVREDAGSGADQPTLLQVLRMQETPGAAAFAAVLGQPVTHSRTPAEHDRFFAKYGWPVYQIDVSEIEWATALHFLQRLGLKAAAVTSPLKIEAYRSSDVKTALAENLKSVNTLWFGACVRGHNTDGQGFAALLAKVPLHKNIGIWGGGGTLDMVRSILPQVIEYSARLGQEKNGRAVAPPEVLIWAVPRSRFSNIWPSWNPQTIIDLNYGDDSPARELALRTGARYISGLAMFKAQAEAQREFWTACGESDHVSQ